MKLRYFLLAAAMATPAFADTVRVVRNPVKPRVIKIEVGEHEHFNQRDFDRYMKRVGYDYKSHHRANRRLRMRVRDLELAVKQLQAEVFKLQHQEQPRPAKRFVCMVKTDLDGTFMAKDASRLGAKAKALKKCEKKAGDFWCKKAVVSCEEEF